MDEPKITPAELIVTQDKEVKDLMPWGMYTTVSMDKSLQFVVDLVEDSTDELSVGITLLVGGRLITGQLISASSYYKLFAEKWRSLLLELGADDPQSFIDSLVAMGEKSTQVTEYIKEREERTGIKSLTGWISLKEVSVFHGATTIPTDPAMLIRLRVSAIEGFTIGNLTKKV